jgi:hypothetical protein
MEWLRIQPCYSQTLNVIEKHNDGIVAEKAYSNQVLVFCGKSTYRPSAVDLSLSSVIKKSGTSGFPHTPLLPCSG